MEQSKKEFFIKAGLINLTLIALIGALMRYKIGFEFPFFNQKNLLHAHSHYAFAGWVTHILFTLMVLFLKNNITNKAIYDRLLKANLICAAGMLISFTIQGYGPVSITFSTLSILIGYCFSYFYIKDLNNLPDHPSKNWFKAALLFNVLSSLGTFYLAYMMVTKNINQHSYLGSVYFYLHFQYSGWFFFAIMGLIIDKFAELPSFSYDSQLFKTFFSACVPAYFLSILWAKLPWYLYILPVVAVLLQLWGLSILIKKVRTHLRQIKSAWPKPVRWLLGLAFFALIIKLLLQTGSVFPEISKLAFGFRSIVIAYLHLVLLAFTTLFLLGYLLLNNHIRQNKISVMSLIVFSVGVFANEFVLMIQGVASFAYILVPHLNEVLFGVSLVMLLSMVTLMLNNFKEGKHN
ncbi:MAG: hypothetical protein IPO37_07635 [Saprospiraceae bacterium]|jgi:hypothetical protein|nr:hypothetical protein [Saprospiraceae bacterium]